MCRETDTLRMSDVVSVRYMVPAIFLYVLVASFSFCLTAIIRINAITIRDFSFHCRAVEILYQTRALLSLKDSK